MERSMSMWQIARESSDGELFVPEADTDTGLSEYTDRILKWIPGDVLALYATGVTTIGKPSWWWLIVAIVLSPALVLLVPFTSSGHLDLSRPVTTNAALGLVATLLWTLTIPNSGWQNIAGVSKNASTVALVVAVVGLLFSAVAEGFSQRAKT
jgi:hypothetical protein